MNNKYFNKLNNFWKNGKTFVNNKGERVFYKEDDEAYEIEDILSEIVLNGDEMKLDKAGRALLRENGFEIICEGTDKGELLDVRVCKNGKTFVVGGI